MAIYDYYVDDGYSGTNFERPAFKKMITDIENGKINCVITKDLSRLGRNYLESGAYIGMYFPQKNVRYILILSFALPSSFDNLQYKAAIYFLVLFNFTLLSFNRTISI